MHSRQNDIYSYKTVDLPSAALCKLQKPQSLNITYLATDKDPVRIIFIVHSNSDLVSIPIKGLLSHRQFFYAQYYKRYQPVTPLSYPTVWVSTHLATFLRSAPDIPIAINHRNAIGHSHVGTINIVHIHIYRIIYTPLPIPRYTRRRACMHAIANS